MIPRSLSHAALSVPRTARFFAGVPDRAGSRRGPSGAPAPEPDFLCFTGLLREVLAADRAGGDASAPSASARALGRRAV